MDEVRQRPTVALRTDARGTLYRELLNGQIVRGGPKKRSRRRERRDRAKHKKDTTP